MYVKPAGQMSPFITLKNLPPPPQNSSSAITYRCQKKSHHRQNHKVRASGEIRNFVELESYRNQEEYQLHSSCHDRAQREIIPVQDPHFRGHSTGFLDQKAVLPISVLNKRAIPDFRQHRLIGNARNRLTATTGMWRRGPWIVG